MAKKKAAAATKKVRRTCSACVMFRATPGSKKNEQVNNLCVLTGNRRVIEAPTEFSCDSYTE